MACATTCREAPLGGPDPLYRALAELSAARAQVEMQTTQLAKAVEALVEIAKHEHLAGSALAQMATDALKAAMEARL